MARRCCLDTVAWELTRLRKPPTDGLEIPCRWCDGFATCRAGLWVYSDEMPIGPKMDRLGSPELIAHRAKRIREILK